MIIDYITKKCPKCGNEVLCDLHDCSCIFGHCEECGTDYEFEKNCKNIGD